MSATTQTTTQKNAQAKQKNSTLGQRTEERLAKENQWQQYNSEANFFPGNIQKSLEILAAQTFPTDTVNRNAYQEAMLQSLTETLSPEVGVKDFWEKMAEAGCQNLKIEDGHLNFYDSDMKHMDITSYTQAIIFEAHSSYYDQRVLERKQRIQTAQQQLQDLIQEINKKRTL